ncbi:MAG TPA: CUAEP/CCAEP-tail radical SAM protein [Anaerolineae bacterium]
MNVVLISTYELGHQPFGLASPAAWLKRAGANVTCLDLAVQSLSPRVVATANLIAFYLPMHTATRLAAAVIRQVQALNSRAHLCCYGLYAPLNERYLRQLGVDTVLGGEFETGLVSLYRRLVSGQPVDVQAEPVISLARQQFERPERRGLPALTEYAWLQLGDGRRRTAGYTEATRGCKHTCRHCPIVPVYNGRFRVVQREVVLEDVRQQVAAGAQHITFGDPDFFNGPGHTIPIVEALHAEFPHLTYDVTIKIEHLLQRARYLPVLRDTGCLLVTSAVEAVDDRILALLDKGHTRTDFIETVALLRDAGLALNPTFVAFTPWTSAENYLDLLALLGQLDLIDNVSPIQYAIRLLIPAGSKLLELPETRAPLDEFDEAALAYPWAHPDPVMDELYETVFALVKAHQRAGEPRWLLFRRVWQAAEAIAPGQRRLEEVDWTVAPEPVPALSEEWY